MNRSVSLCAFVVALFMIPACSGDNGEGQPDASMPGEDAQADTEEEGLGDLPELPTISCDDSGEPGEHVSTETYRMLDPGLGFGCGVTSDGEIICWGDTAQLQGIDEASGNYRTVETTQRVACALTQEDVAQCWGFSQSGVDEPPNPTDRKWQMIDIGFEHGCGIYEDHGVGCWGKDIPASDPPDGKFNDLAVTFNATCGIKRSDHTIECWGRNEDGQMNAPEGKFAAIDGGQGSYCALNYDGEPHCWGYGGQFAPPSNDQFSDIQGQAYACGHRADGTVACWPDENNGDALEPSGNGRCFTDWYIGTSYACGIRADGRGECFGKSNTEMDGRLDIP